ncbi:hypothetical protein IMSAG013_00328 [Clostridiales bacterium]|nr:hypothetical protein IMSAG013_00328 [Clostridiales bacterium]
MHITATGKRFLTTVKNCHYDLSFSSNANHCSGVAVSIVRAGRINGNIFAVFDQYFRTADCLLRSTVRCNSCIPICIVCTAECCTIGKNCKPRAIVCLVRGHYAIHNKRTGWLSGSHIVEVAVCADNSLVIFADECIVILIRILCVCSCHLVCQLVHTKVGALCILISSLNDDVISADVRSGYIVDHLLAVLGVSVVCILLNTRRNS